jgi:gliding motility-associated-like protein
MDSYKLFVKTGEGYEQLAIISPADTMHMISYSEIMYRKTGGEVCFRIMAIENGNPNGVDGESSSAEKCSSTTEIITVPNLFTPDGDMINDMFKPVLSFVPQNYHLIISDRKGKTVFESRSDSEEWDGSLNGSPVPQDVYLWFLKTTGPSGKSVTKTGTVTIIRVR